MTPELTALALAALVQVAQYAMFVIPANRELGVPWTTSPRDFPPPRNLSQRTARLQRALNNHFEALILFTIAVVVVTLGDRSSGFTQVCAGLYIGARVLYIPAYLYGLSPLRSVIWSVGFFATLAMILASLL